MAPYHLWGKTQPSTQGAKALCSVALAYLSTQFTPLPAPPTLQYGQSGCWVSPDAPVLFHASIFFPLPGKSFPSCLLSNLFLNPEAPTLMFLILVQRSLFPLLCFHSVAIGPLVIQPAFTEHLLYANHCSRHWGYSSKNDIVELSMPSWRLHVGDADNKQANKQRQKRISDSEMHRACG